MLHCLHLVAPAIHWSQHYETGYDLYQKANIFRKQNKDTEHIKTRN